MKENDKDLELIGAIMDRCLSFLKLKNDSELARTLNLKQQTVSAWRNKGAIDIFKIINTCDGVDLNWLFFGKDSTTNNCNNVFLTEDYESVLINLRKNFSKSLCDTGLRLYELRIDSKTTMSDFSNLLQIPISVIVKLEKSTYPILPEIILQYSIKLYSNPIWILFGIGEPYDAIDNISQLYSRIKIDEEQISEVTSENIKFKHQLEALNEVIDRLFNDKKRDKLEKIGYRNTNATHVK